MLTNEAKLTGGLNLLSAALGPLSFCWKHNMCHQCSSPTKEWMQPCSYMKNIMPGDLPGSFWEEACPWPINLAGYWLFICLCAKRMCGIQELCVDACVCARARIHRCLKFIFCESKIWQLMLFSSYTSTPQSIQNLLWFLLLVLDTFIILAMTSTRWQHCLPENNVSSFSLEPNSPIGKLLGFLSTPW